MLQTKERWGLVSSVAGWDRPQTCGPTGGVQTLGQRQFGLCHQPVACVKHLVLPRWFSRTGDISWGCAAAGDAHHTVPQTTVAGEKGLQLSESLFGHGCPFSSGWCLVAGHSTSGGGWSRSKSTAICFCGGQSRAPCFGTSPLPCSSLKLIVGDAGK